MPIVGVIPAIKPVSEFSKIRCIDFLATPRNVKREYTKQLIQNFASDCTVINFGYNALVDIAECYLRKQSVYIEEYQGVLARD